MSTGLPMSFVVERDGHDVSLTATPKVTVVDQGVFGKRRMGHLGLASSADPKDAKIERCGLPTCAVWGAGQEWFIVKATTAYIVGIFAGRESTDQVSGLIGAAQMAGEMAKISLWELFSLAAWFSVSVGFMNLLPIPLLDGGHLVFYACEAVLGRPLSERMQEIGLRIGIALVGAAGRVHHLARHSAPRFERQLTISRPSFRVLPATPSGNGVVSPNKGLQERLENCKTPLIVPAPRAGDGRVRCRAASQSNVAG